MPRPEVHTADAILDAARALVLDGGARATTVNGVATASGAPKGSIYHRFGSLNDLLAEMWIRAVRRSQAEFLAATKASDPRRAATGAAVSIHDFAQRERADARLLAGLRREDLVETVDAPHIREALAELNRPLQTTLAELARRLYGQATRTAVERTIFAAVDIPQGAIRRHLTAGTAFPPGLRGQIETASRAALGEERQG